MSSGSSPSRRMRTTPWAARRRPKGSPGAADLPILAEEVLGIGEPRRDHPFVPRARPAGGVVRAVHHGEEARQEPVIAAGLLDRQRALVIAEAGGQHLGRKIEELL